MDFKVALLQQKKMLRKEVLSKRRAYNQNELAIQSNNICQKIIKMPLFESSLNIMVYLAMSDEVNIDNLIKDCLNKCKLVVVPEVVDETGIMNGGVMCAASRRGLAKGVTLESGAARPCTFS